MTVQLANVWKEKGSIVDNFVNNKIEISNGFPELNNFVRASPLVKATSRSGYATPQKKNENQFSVPTKPPMTTKQGQEMFSTSKLRK